LNPLATPTHLKKDDIQKRIYKDENNYFNKEINISTYQALSVKAGDPG